MARAGDVIGGKYRLIHPLGIGGMGAVWRAEHVALRQQVAVKLLDARGPNAERSVRRFQREAQIAASIHHRNVVYISDFGVDGGEPYLVMELLSGIPLSERMVVGEPLSVCAFLRMMDQVLLGLCAVHAGGVVHRDIKPENIFLVREADASLLPKLLDFGVSRSTERGQGHTITREGVVMGTPEYVSPEQARGKAADARSDLYSLGVVIYEALAGRLPFHADNHADLIVAMLNAQPVPLAVMRPDLSGPLAVLVEKAMARDPALRFQTADEMRAEIGRLLAGHPELELYALPRRFVDPTSVSDSTPPLAMADGHLSATLSLPSAPKQPFLKRPAVRRRAVTLLSVVSVAWLAYVGFGFARSDKRVGAAEGPRAAERLSVTQGELVPSDSPAEGGGDMPVEEVHVALDNLPPGAEVRVDGRVTPPGDIRMERNSGLHEIIVRTRARGIGFRVNHDAAAGGRYDVARDGALREEEAARNLGPQRPKRVAKTASGLVRSPDF